MDLFRRQSSPVLALQSRVQWIQTCDATAANAAFEQRKTDAKLTFDRDQTASKAADPLNTQLAKHQIQAKRNFDVSQAADRA
ncbi:hypothetical protein BV898_05457 [Hypsibius exemplaris]|uniref:Uncharacterized protein n=1 Tax=Hypsibius exemplaris TaxID=2072580 RepID=A0A1W0WZJ7_HYPEX|nr:hypothetical protein BV898_05457 [Hypsibius exemplaris]